MARGKKHSQEQIANLPRQTEVGVAIGKTTGLACKEAAITEQNYYRWRKEFGGVQVEQARRLKELEYVPLSEIRSKLVIVMVEPNSFCQSSVALRVSRHLLNGGYPRQGRRS